MVLLAVRANPREGSERLFAQWLVDAFLHQLGVAEHRSKRGPELVAHVGDEPRFVLAGNLELAALLGNLVEQPGVFQRNRRPVRKALHETNHRRWKFARRPALQDKRAKRAFSAEKRDDEGRAHSCFKSSISERIARTFRYIGSLHQLAARNGFAKSGFRLPDVEPAVSFDRMFIQAGGLTEFEPAGILAKIEDQARISTGQLDGAVDNGLEHHIEVKRRADRTADFAQRCQVAVTSLDFLE
jgi:hypothetical protein